jgi:hypothetical protein
MLSSKSGDLLLFPRHAGVTCFLYDFSIPKGKPHPYNITWINKFECNPSIFLEKDCSFNVKLGREIFAYDVFVLLTTCGKIIAVFPDSFEKFFLSEHL